MSEARDVLARARCHRHWLTPCDPDGCDETLCIFKSGAADDIATLAAAGFVVVPVEPTRAMSEAGAQAIACESHYDGVQMWEANAAYRAMIAAAPQGASDDAR